MPASDRYEASAANVVQVGFEPRADSGLTSAFRVLTGRIGFGQLVLPCHPKPLDSPICSLWLWRFRRGDGG